MGDLTPRCTEPGPIPPGSQVGRVLLGGFSFGAVGVKPPTGGVNKRRGSHVSHSSAAVSLDSRLVSSPGTYRAHGVGTRPWEQSKPGNQPSNQTSKQKNKQTNKQKSKQHQINQTSHPDKQTQRPRAFTQSAAVLDKPDVHPSLFGSRPVIRLLSTSPRRPTMQ